MYTIVYYTVYIYVNCVVVGVCGRKCSILFFKKIGKVYPPSRLFPGSVLKVYSGISYILCTVYYMW